MEPIKFATRFIEELKEHANTLAIYVEEETKTSISRKERGLLKDFLEDEYEVDAEVKSHFTSYGTGEYTFENGSKLTATTWNETESECRTNILIVNRRLRKEVAIECIAQTVDATQKETELEIRFENAKPDEKPLRYRSTENLEDGSFCEEVTLLDNEIGNGDLRISFTYHLDGAVEVEVDDDKRPFPLITTNRDEVAKYRVEAELLLENIYFAVFQVMRKQKVFTNKTI